MLKKEANFFMYVFLKIAIVQGRISDVPTEPTECLKLFRAFNSESSPYPLVAPPGRGDHVIVSWFGCRRGRRSVERLQGCRHFPENS